MPKILKISFVILVLSVIDTPSGLTHGIFASGTGRVEDCKVSNMRVLMGFFMV